MRCRERRKISGNWSMAFGAWVRRTEYEEYEREQEREREKEEEREMEKKKEREFVKEMKEMEK